MSAASDEISLPLDLWLYIFSFLDYTDLLRCAQVNNLLNEAANHKSHWQRLCKKYWLISHCPPQLTWKESFYSWFKDFGKYIHCYNVIRTAWSQIISYLEEFCPHIYESIKDGVSEEELNVVEERLGYKLPDDLRCSFRIHNGQRLTCPGLMGSMEIPTHYRSESFLDLDTSSAGFQDGCLPLTICVYSGVSQFMTLSEERCLPLHNIFYSVRNDFGIAKNAAFVSAKNFTVWFSSYAQALRNNEYPIIRNQPFRFTHSPDCEAVTGHIKISVATCFLPECSSINPPHFIHTYRITLFMANDAPEAESCQLERRHWVITHENGQTEIVDGSGVVGEYPVLKPGTTFSWISCTGFKTSYGKMEGHFTMRLLQTGKLINIRCPTFHMRSLPCIVLPESSQNGNKKLKKDTEYSIS